MLAASLGHEAAVKLLLERKAETDLKDRFGQTAMENAVLCGHSSLASLIGFANTAPAPPAPPAPFPKLTFEKKCHVEKVLA